MNHVFFEDITVGDEFTSVSRTIDTSDITRFAELSGDFNPLHVDREWVRQHTGYRDCIAHGLLMLSVTSGLATAGLDDWQILAYLNVDRKMVSPTYSGDTVYAKSVVGTARRSGSRPDTGVVKVNTTLYNQCGSVVQTGTDTYLIAARTSG